MKPLRCNIAVLALWSVLAVLAGCTHKKPAQAAPPQPPPVATTPEPWPTPTPAAEPSPTPQGAQAASPDQADTQTTQTDKAQKPKKPSPRKTASASSGSDKQSDVAHNNPPRKIIPADKAEPAPQPGQISPVPADGTQPQGSTEQLLKSAEANLNSINRQLSKVEEAKLSQAREFINRSRKATSDNDSAGAYNYALKARLLSDELVQQR